MTYAEKLRDPRWQKARLKIMERDEWRCRSCRRADLTLNVHHAIYRNGFNPWDYPAWELVTLCEVCHKRHEYIKPDLFRAACCALPSSVQGFFLALERLPHGQATDLLNDLSIELSKRTKEECQTGS
jgi:hypothetical protein